MKIAIPDLVSPSYFPVLAAVELGCFRRQGLSVEVEVVFQPDCTYAALRDGAVDMVGSSAHAAVSAFPAWEGVRLVCAQSHGMYWFLVMHSDLAVQRGDLSALKGRRIGAAPWVRMGLEGMLEAAGLEPARDGIEIVPVPKAPALGPGLGLAAAHALETRQIDGFWANGMAAELAVRSGAGDIVIDARRDEGPQGATDYTFAAVAARQAALDDDPAFGPAVVRAIDEAHALLRADIARAEAVGRRYFPSREAGIVAALISCDVPWYDTTLSPERIAAMNAFLRARGALDRDVAFERIAFGAQDAPVL